MKVPPTSMSTNVGKLINLAEFWLDTKRAPYIKDLDKEGLPQLSVNFTNNSSLPEFILELMPRQVLKKLDIPFSSANDLKKQFPYFVLTKEGNVVFCADLKTLIAKHPLTNLVTNLDGHLSAGTDDKDSDKIIIAFKNGTPEQLIGN